MRPDPNFYRGLLNGILFGSLAWGVVFVIVVVIRTIFWK